MSFNNEICYLNYDTKHFFFFYKHQKHVFQQYFLNHSFHIFLNNNFWTLWPNRPQVFGFGTLHFEYNFLHLFLVKLVFETKLFQLFLLLEINVRRVFWHKSKCDQIYRNKSMHVSRSNKTIN